MQPVHLAILIHGLYGSKDNLLQLEAELIEAHAGLPESSDNPKPRLYVLIAQGIAGQLTHDGVDIQARQVSKEVDAAVEQLYQQGEDVVAVTITGYSLGGLVARFLVGLLDSRSPSFFDRHRPAAFCSIATPHLGIPRYNSRMSRVQHFVGPSLFSSSGRQLFCNDAYTSDGRCLLDVMADPNQRFIRALQRFESIRIIANGCHDQTVPFPTAVFSEVDPFVDFAHSGLQLELDEDQVIQSWHLPDKAAAPGTPAEGEEATDALLQAGPADVGTTRRGRSVAAATLNRKKKSWPPPVQVALNFRFPFNYILLTCLPVLVPLFICFTFVTLAYHSFLSYRRMSTLLTPEEKASLLLHDALDAVNDMAGRSEESRSDDFEEDPTGLRSIGHSGSSTPVITNTVPLQLSSKQISMSRNLNRALPHARKIVTWFPSAYNSHAMIVLRDAKRFPAQEEARGLVRRWATMTAQSGAQSAIAGET